MRQLGLGVWASQAPASPPRGGVPGHHDDLSQLVVWRRRRLGQSAAPAIFSVVRGGACLLRDLCWLKPLVGWVYTQIYMIVFKLEILVLVNMPLSQLSPSPLHKGSKSNAEAGSETAEVQELRTHRLDVPTEASRGRDGPTRARP